MLHYGCSCVPRPSRITEGAERSLAREGLTVEAMMGGDEWRV
ncbi:FKBP-type peptidyl-prolyl cis-trans isomerase [Schaalia cardiffensis F0333]|uniref:FKBP-type peptidyl-prolyl cis-trans isomerase n=1 Tax=Schaalia cardiffensis F0333 TaxID=888050 RepID=N6XA47_9ACTO|nr:FKBP-type peptidyl-prolyl cis-trans isomerase [Schaalia cardiffensis F0333]